LIKIAKSSGRPQDFNRPQRETNSYFRTIHRTTLVNAALPRKISNLFSGWVGRSFQTRRIAFMTAILIVEDDVLANEHLEFILQQAGYEVVSATSADEAAALLEDREDIQLIVTDINLPGTMNGLRLAAAVKDRRPAVHIIIATGYGAPKADEIPPGSLFVPKPYSARKMIEAVRHFQ
jgi:CheY-like chemotaxis protein